MALKVSSLDFGQVLNNLGKLDAGATKMADNALQMIAEEVMRLSQREVPHDVGTLQNSGTVKTVGPLDKIVGYHTRYAARLHEHPEFHFQKGRKGKYLEDPIKNNKSALLRFFGETVKDGMRGTL